MYVTVDNRCAITTQTMYVLKKILMHVMIIQSKYSSKTAIEKPSLLKFFCMKIWMRNRYLVRCWLRQESFVWCCKDGTLFAYQDCGSIIQSIISAFSGCIKIETVIRIFQWRLYLFFSTGQKYKGYRTPYLLCKCSVSAGKSVFERSTVDRLYTSKSVS